MWCLKPTQGTTGFWEESEPLPVMSPLIDSLRQESQPGNNMHTYKRNKPSRLYIYIVHTHTYLDNKEEESAI